MTDSPTPKPVAPPLPSNETERLAALHRYRILDTPAEAAFDRITRLAARLFGMPTVLISLVDDSRAWFKSCIGFDAREVPRDNTLCSFAVLTDTPLIVPDARQDDRFACNPFVQGEPGVRFYAGAPLLSQDGFNLGTLCLLDSQPHDPLTPEQQATLVDLAALVVDELDLRLAVHQSIQSEEKYRALFESIDEGFCVVEVLFDADDKPIDHRVLQANPAFERQSGIANPEGKTASELAPGVKQFWNNLYAQVIQTGESIRTEIRSDAFDRWFDVLVSRVNDAALPQVAIVFSDISDRKRAEIALQQTSDELERQVRKFDAIATAVPDFIYTFNLSGRFTFVNQPLLNLWQRTLAEALGKNFFELDYPEDLAAQLQNQIQQVIETRQPLKDETPYTSAVGTGAYEYILVPLLGANGAVEAVAGVTRDITDRKQVEESLRESEERFRNMADNAPVMVWVTDPTGYCTYLSQRWYNFTGQTEATGLGFGWLSRVHPDDREMSEQIFLNANQRQEAFVLEYRLQNQQGEYIWAIDAASPWFGVEGQFKGYIGSVLDISDRKRVEDERKQAELALRESEERYRTLFESIDEGFCVVEMLFDQNNTPIDYRILEVNPIFEQQTGLHQAIGQTARQLNLEEHWIKVYGRVALTGESIRFENGSETLDRWFDVYACRTGEPEARRVAIVFRDITERKRREAHLAFLANIAEDFSRLSTADEIMQAVGAKTGTYLNIFHCFFAEINAAQDRAVVEYDWNPSNTPDLIGVYQLSEFLTEDFLQASQAGETIAIRNTQTDPRTDANRHAALNVHAFVTVPFHRNNEWKYLLTVNDSVARDWREDEIELIRELANRVFPRLERAHAEAVTAADLRDTRLLRDLSARLVIEGDNQTLYQEVLSAAIALTRADAGTVQIFDSATQDLVLIATQGFERNMIEHFYRVDASSHTPCGIAIRNGDRSFVDFDVPEREDPDGSLRRHIEAGYLSAQSTPLISRSGRAIGMISTHWGNAHRPSDRELRFLDLLARQAADLIEQRQTVAEQEQLLAREQAARAEADRANRIKDEFLAVLSHELRSPLNPILGWTRLLQNGKLDAARQSDALKTIERNAKLQSQLVEDLLDISRIMQGKLSLIPAPVSLTFVISAAVETVLLAAEAKQIQITLDLDSTLPPISGDIARLQQVVWNLLTNAVKFTPIGGQVMIELRQIDQMAQFCITDTGRGIAPQFLPHVFEYFRQEDGSSTRRFGGLGLGLAIVRQIVEMHGGTVQAESQGENRGATFRVQLPIPPQVLLSLPETTRSPAANELPLNQVQILVVDDDPDTREFQAFLLEQSGAGVIAVASGSEALQVLDRWIPDVLVSDVGMAEMDGHRLIQHIRARPPEQGGSIPAIALTAYAAEVDRQKAIQAGFQTHLTKPVEPERLVMEVVSLLNSNSG